MEIRELGGLRTSALGFGCMGLSQGYGPVGAEQALAAVHRGLDEGVRLLDTAMSYGAGHNERLLARVLRERRADAEVATKFGIVRGADGVGLDGRPERVPGYCDASLRRLGVDVVDLYYLHRVDPAVPIADTVGAMAELVRAGKVRHLGLSEVTPAQLAAAAAVHPIAAVQFEWSLMWREAEDELIPAARAAGAGLVPYSPLGRGLLTATVDGAAGSDFRGGDPRFQGEHLDANLTRVAAVRAIAAGIGVTAGQLALAWLLAQGPDVVPIPGSRNPDRVAENVAAAAIRLDDEAQRRLSEVAGRSAWSGDRQSFAAQLTTRS